MNNVDINFKLVNSKLLELSYKEEKIVNNFNDKEKIKRKIETEIKFGISRDSSSNMMGIMINSDYIDILGDIELSTLSLKYLFEYECNEEYLDIIREKLKTNDRDNDIFLKDELKEYIDMNIDQMDKMAELIYKESGRRIK